MNYLLYNGELFSQTFHFMVSQVLITKTNFNQPSIIVFRHNAISHAVR